MNSSDILSLTLHRGSRINVLRNDGRIHSATVTNISPSLRCASVEWVEGDDVKGKELSFDVIHELNKHLAVQNTEPINSTIGPSLKVCSRREIVPPKVSLLKDLSIINESVECRPKRISRFTLEPSRERFYSKSIPQLPDDLSRNKRFSFKSASVSEDIKIPKKLEKSNRKSVSIMENLNEWKGERIADKQQTHGIDKLRFNMNYDSSKASSSQFSDMINTYRNSLTYELLGPHDPPENHQLVVCVRKRPLNKLEVKRKEIDVVTVPSKDTIIIHEPKFKVDLTKYLENQQFKFDCVFDEFSSNESIYNATAKPLVRTMFNGGNATCFAYGQTGSGKTHTMVGAFSDIKQDYENGIYSMLSADIFKKLKYSQLKYEDIGVSASFYEIYGGKVFDLLADKVKLRVLEDKSQQIQIVGLTHKIVTCPEEVITVIKEGNRSRTSCRTSCNTNSSRSHAIFQIKLLFIKTKQTYGKISLIDLAGNERGIDTSSSDLSVRQEGAEINKSLLALKECIRALGRKGTHLPFRGSTLTQVLKDSFIGENSRTCMIATVSPGMNSCEHSLNTLRYAARVKELESSSGSYVQDDNGVSESSLSDGTSKRDSSLYDSSPEYTNSYEVRSIEEAITPCEKYEGEMLEGFRIWMNNRLRWDNRESDLLIKKSKQELNKNEFSKELHTIIKEQQNFLKHLEEKVIAFKENKAI